MAHKMTQIRQMTTDLLFLVYVQSQIKKSAVICALICVHLRALIQRSQIKSLCLCLNFVPISSSERFGVY